MTTFWEKTLFVIVGALVVSGCTVGVLSIASCGTGSGRPVVNPNPVFANCEARKDQIENDCLIEAGTRANFDECVARVRKSCIDGGQR